MPALQDRKKMRNNRTMALSQTSGLTPDERARQLGVIEWEYRRGVREDIDMIMADLGRFSYRRGSLGEDITAYITREEPCPPTDAQTAPISTTATTTKGAKTATARGRTR